MSDQNAIGLFLTKQGELKFVTPTGALKIELDVDAMRSLAGQLLAVSDEHERLSHEADGLLSGVVGHA